MSQLRLLFSLLSHSPRPTLSPRAILATAHNAGGHFEAGAQHDCSEFMCFFLDALHEQGKAYAQHVGRQFEEDLREELGMLQLGPKGDAVGNEGEGEERASSAREAEDMDEDEGEEEEEEEEEEGEKGEEEEMQEEGQVGMKRWTTEEDLSSSEGRRLQVKRKALSLAEFSSVTATEADSAQDVDEKSVEVAENGQMVQSGVQALSDSHSDSTDSGIQSVGEEDGVNVVVNGAGTILRNDLEGESKAGKSQVGDLSKGGKKLWGENSDARKIRREFCTIVQQEFGGVAQITHQCLSCGSVSVRADPFRDLQLAFPEDSEEAAEGGDGAQESQGFIGPQLPQHVIPLGDIRADEEGVEPERSKEMEVEEKATVAKKQHHSGPWGVGELLGHYLSTETLRGENRYHCTKCKGLQDARRSVSLTWPPPRHLLLTLKHFRFDRSTARRSKALRPLRVELSIEVPVALSRSHRSNAAKRRKTRSTQTREESEQKEEEESGEERVGVADSEDSSDKKDCVPTCANAMGEIQGKKGEPLSPNSDFEKAKVDSVLDEGEVSVVNKDSSVEGGGSFSRRRRRTPREEEGVLVDREERAYIEERKVTYHLYAAIVHSGFSLDGGHYYTYARRPLGSQAGGATGEDEWCVLNDSHVSVQSGPEGFSEPSGHRPQDTPYVLFYMLEGMNNLGSPDWQSLPIELRDAVEADGTKFIREEDWRWKHSSKSRPGGGGGFNRKDGDGPPPSSCGGGMGSGFGSMGGHFVF